MKYPAIALIILFITLLRPAESQALDRISFTNLTTGDGLSDNNIEAITQDHSGFLWIATESGLNRYDGHRFKIYTHTKNNKAGLPDKEIVALFVDKDNRLWVGMENGGVSMLNQQTGKFTHYKKALNDKGRLKLDGIHISSNNVHAINQDKQGNIYLGTEGSGLNVIDAKTGKISYYFSNSRDNKSLCHNEVKTMMVDSQNIIWLGTVGGLNKFSPRTKSFTCYQKQEGKRHTLGNNEVVGIGEDSEGVLWIATEGGGINSFNTKHESFITYSYNQNKERSLSDNELQNIYVDSSDTVWASTINGLNRFNRESEDFDHFFHDPQQKNSIGSNVISSVFQDRSGIIWIGTEGGGLSKLNADKFPISSSKPYADADWYGDAIDAIFQDKNGVLWVGTENEGLFNYDSKTGQYQNFKYLGKAEADSSPSEISAITGKNNDVWLGAEDDGLYRYDIKQKRFSKFDLPFEEYNSVTSMFMGTKHRLWIGTEENRIFEINTLNNKVITHKIEPLVEIKADLDNEVRTIIEDANDNIWIGTENHGLIMFASDRMSFQHFQVDSDQQSTISDNYINAVTEDANGEIWIATDYGLNRFISNTEGFEKFFIEDGLITNDIVGITTDKNNDLWLSTNKGLIRFQTKANKFSNYNNEDGLSNEQYIRGSYFKSEGGLLFFGGNSGIDRFDPLLVPKNQTPPTTVLTSLKLFDLEVEPDGEGLLNKPIHQAKQIVLSHKDYVFSFEFAALDFTNPAKNQFSFYLDGFDEDWRQVSDQRIASYTNLQPGNYTFKVKGSNNDGVWSTHAAELEVIISPAPWKTWWAYTSYLGFLILSVYLFLQYYLKRQKDAFTLLQEREEKRRLQDSFDMEQRFTSDVAHELRTPLAELINMAEIAIMWPDDERITQEFHKNTLEAASQMQQIVNNLLALARCERGLISLNKTSVDLCEEINAAWDRHIEEASNKNMSLITDMPEHAPTISSQAELALILNNMMSNAIEYSAEDQQIKASITPLENGYRLRVSNPSVEALSQEDLSLMFQRLWRKDLARSSDKHSGLGMSLIKAYAELLNYTIRVEISPENHFVIEMDCLNSSE